MKLAIPDLISNSYFPAVAAAELGFFAREGLDVSAELIFPVDRAYAGAARRRGRFRRRRRAWRARRLSRMARRQAARRAGAGHVLVSRHACRSRHRPRRPRGAAGSTHRRRALGRDGAAPPPRRRRSRPRRDDIRIGPVPGADRLDRQFRPDRGAGAGAAARSTASGPTAWRPRSRSTAGVGTIVLDVRRGDGPPGCFDYTMPVLATTERLIESSPDTAAAAVRALVAAQNVLKADVVARHRGRRRSVSRRARPG